MIQRAIGDLSGAYAPVPAGPFLGGVEVLRGMAEAVARGQRVVVTGAGGQVGVGRHSLVAAFCDAARESLRGEALWLPGQAFDPRLVVTRLAVALGAEIPDGRARAAERAIERLLDGRRPLIVLEETTAQVAGLFPRSTPMIAIVRDPASARALGGALFEVGPWSRQSWERVLPELLGGEREGEARVAREIGPLLGFHPLSITLALRLLRMGAVEDAAALFARLTAKLRRLASFPEARRPVAASFSLLVESLSLEDRARIGALGCLPPEGFTEEAARCALDVDAASGRRATALCRTLGIAHPLGAGRLRLHPLIGDFARGLVDETSARERVASHYLGVAQAASVESGALDVEIDGVLHALRWAAGSGASRLSLDLCLAIAPWMSARGFTEGVATFLRWGLTEAENLRDALAEGRLLRHLARAQLGRRSDGRDSAAASLQRAADRLAGAPAEQAEALAELGELYAAAQDILHLAEVLDRLEPLVIAARLEPEARRASALALELAQILARQGEDDGALAVLERGAALASAARDADDLETEIRQLAEAVRGRRTVRQAFAEDPPEVEVPASAPAASAELSHTVEPAAPGPPAFDALDPQAGTRAYEVHLRRLERALAAGDAAEVARQEATLGRLLGARGEIVGALEHYQRALEHHRRQGDRTGAAEALRDMGALSALAGDLDDALCRLLGSLDLAEGIAQPSARAGTLLELSRVLISRGEHEGGLAHLASSEGLFERAEDARGIAAVRLARSAALVQGEAYGEAMAWATRGLELAEELEDGALIAEAEHVLGDLAMRRRDFPEAARRLRRSIYLRHVEADAVGVAASMHALGELHRRRGDHVAAWSYHRRIREVASSLGLSRLQAQCGEALGDLAREAGHWQEAEAEYGVALASHRRAGDATAEAVLLLKLGDVALDRAAPVTALEAFTASLRICERRGLHRGTAVASYKVGLCLATLGDAPAARDALRAGLARDASQGDERGVAASLVLLGQLEAAEGRASAARTPWERARALLAEADPSAAQTLDAWLARLLEAPNRASHHREIPDS